MQFGRSETMNCSLRADILKPTSNNMIRANLLFGLRVWGTIYYDDIKHSCSARCTVFASKLCSSIFEVLNIRLLKFRPTPGGSLTLLSPPGGFRV